MAEDGQVSGAMDGKVHVWDLAAAAPGCSPLRTITGHPLGVLCLAIAPDGASIATAGFDRSCLASHSPHLYHAIIDAK